MFQHREGDCAIVSEGGVFKQVDVYERNGVLYAKTSGGFVRLYADGSTSKAKCRLDTLSVETPLYRSRLGYLCAKGEGEGVKALSPPEVEKLTRAE